MTDGNISLISGVLPSMTERREKCVQDSRPYSKCCTFLFRIQTVPSLLETLRHVQTPYVIFLTNDEMQIGKFERRRSFLCKLSSASLRPCSSLHVGILSLSFSPSNHSPTHLLFTHQLTHAPNHPLLSSLV